MGKLSCRKNQAGNFRKSDEPSIAMLTSSTVLHDLGRIRLGKDHMRRTKRLSIEFSHREVTLTVEGSTLKPRTAHPETSRDSDTCPECNSPWITVVEPASGQLADDADRICQALRASGLHLQVSQNGQLKICQKSFDEIKEMF
jgi:hypothetical protein